jgi:hypothetical protein
MAKGKVIDKWNLTIRKKRPKVDPTDVFEDDEDFTTKVEVPVRLVPAKNSYVKTEFLVDFKYGEYYLRKQMEDINELRAETIKWLESVVTFEWVDYFYVEFGSGQSDDDKEHSHEESRISAFFKFSLYQLGTDQIGNKFYRDLTRTLNGGSVLKGSPEVSDECHVFRWDEDVCLKALVKKTPETEAMLNKIKAGYVDLAAKLREFLHPEGIEQRLIAAASQPFKLLGQSEKPEQSK